MFILRFFDYSTYVRCSDDQVSIDDSLWSNRPSLKNRKVCSITRGLCIIKLWLWGSTIKSDIPSNRALWMEMLTPSSAGIREEDSILMLLFPAMMPTSKSTGPSDLGKFDEAVPSWEPAGPLIR